MSPRQFFDEHFDTLTQLHWKRHNAIDKVGKENNFALYGNWYWFIAKEVVDRNGVSCNFCLMPPSDLSKIELWKN